MKLIVLAQTPPPVHGQNQMVDLLVRGLPAYGIEVHHIHLPLSRDIRDIGRWRWGKLWALLGACFRVYRTRRRIGPAPLYYVPAPAKRGALYRDWIAMLLCRPLNSSLVLHWHAVGLGRWLETKATLPERLLSRLLLGRATLSLVLAETLAEDAQFLDARRTLVLPNGIIDPGEPIPRPPRHPSAPCKLLYLGLCSEEKGLFELIDALLHSHSRQPGHFHLTVAGSFPSAAVEQDFRARAAPLGTSVHYVGLAGEKLKHALLREADVFCFPSHYPHEGQPLVLMEALAHDLPVVTTRWRAIPGMLPGPFTWIVEPGRPALLAAALLEARSCPRPGGASRRFFLSRYTAQIHLAALATALRTLQSDPTAKNDAP